MNNNRTYQILSWILNQSSVEDPLAPTAAELEELESSNLVRMETTTAPDSGETLHFYITALGSYEYTRLHYAENPVPEGQKPPPGIPGA